ncbi:GTPase IMAP family member 7-like [Halichoeres trimaculatus]|uniref:GTPase IMAP family member 7-like n=1 Tax=Halichoeres trimaculatus TaxID=147232 RepID=UPI003D9ED04B
MDVHWFHCFLSESNTLRVVILGRAGSGKSSLANTILGKQLFQISHTAGSGRSKCQAKTRSVKGRSVTLIDTPGLFDTDVSEGDLQCEILRCITEHAPGPHAFLIVLKVEKFTEQEQAVIDKIEEYFSEAVFRYTTVVFTHGDQLDDGQTTTDFVHHDKSLDELVKRCGGRCHVVDNKYWKKSPNDNYRSNQYQVEEILNTIEKTLEENKGSCYTNEMLQLLDSESSQNVI